MTKKSGGARPKGNAGKKTAGKKPKKAGMFKALKKQEHRTGLVESGKVDNNNIKKAKIAKRPAPVSDELRNFDERMAAKNSRRPGAIAGGAVKATALAPPTFVMTAPTFQFNTNPVQVVPPPREVEGFHGFLSALQAPKDAPVANLNQETYKAKTVQPQYRESNVFNLLDNGDEEQQAVQKVTQAAAPAFMQPATFSFATTAPTFSLPALKQPSQPVAINVAEDIDPDL
ncbi:hypothetical protein BBJ29_008623 [Phytophthora kernoviae]|uniref:Uncharacterized protein n=1 Tax=Phytophthora kernoviae TaxID=325452 RepID=A0A3F2RHY9_9STRA|nr:hypothetical protein BBJ29_008623 [Phytophthora kernoviae]RLN57481.1 hypothetical protein BBP00_00007499 [Phytophthora kernoviae]